MGLERCPHCARPGLFTNVDEAGLPAERRALRKRYRAATERAAARGCADKARRFEEKLADSRAVVNRSGLETARLASSERELFSTFYQLLKAEVRLPTGESWDRLRRIADEALFPGYKEKIRFAALSLDRRGLVSYGDCTLLLREPMISHRASVYLENSTLFLRRHHYDPPLGFRATWEERAKLCVAKVAERLEPSTAETDFPTLLLRQGATSAEDEFVEVHIWGPLSVHCIDAVLVAKRPSSLSPALFLALREILSGVNLEPEELE